MNPDVRPDLFAYLGGIVRQMHGIVLTISGTTTLVHVLVRIHPTNSVAELARVIKANSSTWLHEKGYPDFAWHAGYDVSNVPESRIDAIKQFIGSLEDHLKEWSSVEEFTAFLKKSNIRMSDIKFPTEPVTFEINSRSAHRKR
jgi:hypothetical protein